MLTLRIHERLNEAFNPKTVNIGDQVWMAENLAVDDGGDGIYVADDGTTYYSQDAAIRIAKNTPGWHLPTKAEWSTAKYAAKNLQSELNVELNGYHVIGDLGEDTCHDGIKGYFWTPEKTTSDGSWGRYAYFTNGPSHSLYFLDNNTEGTKFMATVRLVKD